MWIHVQMTWRLLNTLTYATIMSVLRTLRHMCNVILAKTCQQKTCKHPMLLWTYIVYMWQFKIVIIYCIYIYICIYLYIYIYIWILVWMDVNGYMLAGIWDPEAGSGDLWEAWPIFFFLRGGPTIPSQKRLSIPHMRTMVLVYLPRFGWILG